MKEKKNETLKLQELTEELQEALKDTFIATVEKVNGGLKMKFPGGENFFIGISEIDCDEV